MAGEPCRSGEEKVTPAALRETGCPQEKRGTGPNLTHVQNPISSGLERNGKAKLYNFLNETDDLPDFKE